MSGRAIVLGLGLALLLVSGWASVGCGGGGGGGGPTSPPPPGPPPGISFTPDSSAVANSIYLSAGSSAGAAFVLEVEAQSVTDLFGVSFILTYPEDLLAYTDNSESEGTFLSENGSVDTDLQVNERRNGEITVGITRLGQVSGASGSGMLLSLEFTRRSTGTGPIEMTDHDALNSFGDIQTDVTWIGGSVTIR